MAEGVGGNSVREDVLRGGSQEQRGRLGFAMGGSSSLRNQIKTNPPPPDSRPEPPGARVGIPPHAPLAMN